jgi:hypothetical protein
MISGNPQTTCSWESNLIESLNDTQTKKPFENAQSVNCKAGHSYSMVTVQKLFEKMKGTENEGTVPCPDCELKSNFTSYQPNPRLQSLVNAEMFPKLVTKEISSESKHQEASQYPFCRGMYKIQKKEGREGRRPSYHGWNIFFEKTENSNSPINLFQFMVNMNHYPNKNPPEFSGYCRFDDAIEAEKLVVFLANHQIKSDRADTDVWLDIKESKEFMVFVELIKVNNDFDEMSAIKISEESKEMSKIFDSLAELNK